MPLSSLVSRSYILLNSGSVYIKYLQIDKVRSHDELSPNPRAIFRTNTSTIADQ